MTSPIAADLVALVSVLSASLAGSVFVAIFGSLFGLSVNPLQPSFVNCAKDPGRYPALILAERRQHRTWGPKKLRVVLETNHGIATPPACSTIAELMRRHGLSVRRRRRLGVYQADAHGCTKATQPNHVWAVDFKGWLLLGDGQRCDPLTVCDYHSHCILCADAPVNQQYKVPLHVFQGLMRHHGLCRR